MHQKTWLFLLPLTLILLAFPLVAPAADNYALRKIEIPGDGADTVLSPDGKTLAVYEDAAFNNNEVHPELLPVYLVNVDDGKILQTLTDGISDYTSSVAFSPDGKLMASAQQNGQLTLWDASSGQLLKTFTDAIGPHLLEFVAQSHLLLDAQPGTTGLIALWDIDAGVIRQFIQHDYGTLADFQAQIQYGTFPQVVGLAAFPDGKTFAEITQTAGVFQGDVTSGKFTTLVAPSQDMTDTLTRTAPFVTPDGKSILYGDYKSKQIHILDVASGQETGHIDLGDASVPLSHFFAVAPDNDTLAWLDSGGTGSDHGTVHFTSLSKGGDIADVQLPDKLRGRYQAEFTPDGKELVVSGFWNTDHTSKNVVYIITVGAS